MQTVIGRLTADAKVSELRTDVESSISTVAENARFKSKGSNEVKKITTYYNGAYWISTTIAEHMKKGTLVEVSGRIGINAWKNMEGEAKASLTIHATLSSCTANQNRRTPGRLSRKERFAILKLSHC